MTKFAIFLIKLILFIIIFLWLDHNNGVIKIDWLGYEAITPVSITFAVLTGAFIVLYTIIRLWKNLISLPKRMRERADLKNYKNGIDTLYLFVESIFLEGGDGSNSIKDKMKKNKELKELGKFKDALKTHDPNIPLEIQKNPKTAILGKYLQAKVAIAAGNWKEAYECLEKILKKREKSSWALRKIYKTAVQLEKFDEAALFLEKSWNYKLIDEKEYNKNKADLLYKQVCHDGQNLSLDDKIKKLSQAHEFMSSNYEITVMLSNLLKENGQLKNAKHCIKETWNVAQFKQLPALYISINNSSDSLKNYEQIKELTSDTPNHEKSLLAKAQYGLEAKVWGESRNYLMQLEKLYGLNHEAYKILAKLDLQEHGDKNKYMHWLEKAVEL